MPAGNASAAVFPGLDGEQSRLGWERNPNPLFIPPCAKWWWAASKETGGERGRQEKEKKRKDKTILTASTDRMLSCSQVILFADSAGISVRHREIK